MKRKLLAALIFSFTATGALAGKCPPPCPCPCPFTGFYGTADFGVIYPSIKNTTTTELSVPSVIDTVFSNTSRFTDSAVTGGIALGYANMLTQGILGGIEGRANLENVETSSSLTNTETTTSLTATTTTSIKLKNDFALLLKLGVIVNPKVLFYGLIGPDWGNFSVTSSSNYFQNTNESTTVNASTQNGISRYKTGLLLGFGMEALLTQAISLGLEYNHVWYNNLGYPTSSSPASVVSEGSPLPGVLTLNNNTNAQTNTVTLRVNYYLG